MSREDHRLHDEIMALRRQLEQSKMPSSDMRFSAKEFILVATTTLLSFAGMLSENEMVMYFCLVVSCVAYLYVCFKHPGSLFWRFSAAITVSVIFSAMIFFVHQRGLKREQDDAESKLTALPFMPKSGNVFKMGVTVTNGSVTDISSHQVSCYVRRLAMAPAGGIENLGMTTTSPENTILGKNGDGETSYCISLIPLQGTFVCADITVIVSYTLSTQPGIKNSKILRFVATGEDMSWHQQLAKNPNDFCPAPKVL